MRPPVMSLLNPYERLLLSFERTDGWSVDLIDRRTDRQTDKQSYRDARMHIKTVILMVK